MGKARTPECKHVMPLGGKGVLGLRWGSRRAGSGCVAAVPVALRWVISAWGPRPARLPLLGCSPTPAPLGVQDSTPSLKVISSEWPSWTECLLCTPAHLPPLPQFSGPPRAQQQPPPWGLGQRRGLENQEGARQGGRKAIGAQQ